MLYRIKDTHKTLEKDLNHLTSMMQKFTLKKMKSLEFKLRKKMKPSSTAWSVRSIRAGDLILTFVSVDRLLSVCKRMLCGLLVHRRVRGDTSNLVSSGLDGFTLYESECLFGRCLLTFFSPSLQVRRPGWSEFGWVVVRLVVIVWPKFPPINLRFAATVTISAAPDRLRRVCRERIRRLSKIPLPVSTLVLFDSQMSTTSV